MEILRTDQILHFMGIAHKVLGADLRPAEPDKGSFRLDPDRHISPGVFHQSERSLRRFLHVLKQHSLAGKRQENAFLLLDPYQELFHSLVSQGPLAHIIVEIKDPLIFIFQDLIKLPGTEQPACLGKIFDGKLAEVVGTLHLSIRGHHIRLFDNGCKGKLVFTSRADHGKLAFLHMSRPQSPSVIRKLHLCGIPFKSLVFKMHTKRGRVDQPPYCPFVVCLYSKTSPVYFPFPDYENQICFIKCDIRSY